MKMFGSWKELFSLVFRSDNREITVSPHAATTYTAARAMELPPGDSDQEIVGKDSSQILTNKTIDGDVNTVQDLALTSLKTVLGDANEVLRRDSTGLPVSGPVTISDAGAIAAATQLDVDNIQIDTNTISSTNVNGDIILDPNGTGAIALDAHTRLRSGSDLIFQDDDNSQSITVSVPANIGTNRTPQIPDDSGDFVLTSATQTLSNKTVSSPTVTGTLLLQNPSGAQPELALSEDPDNGTNKVTIKAPAALTADYTLTLPADDGSASQFLQTDGAGTLTWASASGGTGELVNHIINGNFDVWQRNTSHVSVATSTVTADRYRYMKSGSQVHDITRSTDTPNIQSQYTLLMDCTTANAAPGAGDFSLLSYRIEGNDLVALAGKEMTLSFWVKATKTGTNSVALQNSAQTRSYVATYSVSVTDTWEYKTITFTHDTTGTWLYDTGIGMSINFTQMAGTTYQTTAGSWQAGNFYNTAASVNNVDSIANNVRLAQVCLNLGGTASTFKRAGDLLSNELDLCQRYYYKSYNLATVPGSSGTDAAAQFGLIVNTNDAYTVADFPTRMRVAPTCSVWTTGGTSGSATVVGVGNATGTLTDIGETGVSRFNRTGGSAFTAGGSINFHFTADAEL